MRAFELQSAMSETLLDIVLQQQARAKKQRESIIIQQVAKQQASLRSSKLYAKAA